MRADVLPVFDISLTFWHPIKIIQFIFLFLGGGGGGVNDAALLNMHIKFKYEIYSSMYNWAELGLLALAMFRTLLRLRVIEAALFIFTVVSLVLSNEKICINLVCISSFLNFCLFYPKGHIILVKENSIL